MFTQDKQRAFEQDETIAVNVNEAKSGAYNVRSSSVSSHGVGGSSESETDGVNPPPPTAQDDGYHTEGNLVSYENEIVSVFQQSLLNFPLQNTF